LEAQRNRFKSEGSFGNDKDKISISASFVPKSTQTEMKMKPEMLVNEFKVESEDGTVRYEIVEYRNMSILGVLLIVVSWCSVCCQIGAICSLQAFIKDTVGGLPVISNFLSVYLFLGIAGLRTVIQFYFMPSLWLLSLFWLLGGFCGVCAAFSDGLERSGIEPSFFVIQAVATLVVIFVVKLYPFMLIFAFVGSVLDALRRPRKCANWVYIPQMLFMLMPPALSIGNNFYGENSYSLHSVNKQHKSVWLITMAIGVIVLILSTLILSKKENPPIFENTQNVGMTSMAQIRLNRKNSEEKVKGNIVVPKKIEVGDAEKLGQGNFGQNEGELEIEDIVVPKGPEGLEKEKAKKGVPDYVEMSYSPYMGGNGFNDLCVEDEPVMLPSKKRELAKAKI
jgi:hypothetical protein